MLLRPLPALGAFAFTCLTTVLSAVDIVAHRGASYDAPENTLAAERLAWSQAADAVETDVHLTKDGKIIVCHDKTTKRTTGKDGTIAAMDFAELRALDAGSWKDPKFAGEKLPTLDEQIALIPKGRQMLVEIKTGPELVPELKRVLARAGASEKNITIISFNYETLQAVRKQLPRYRTLYLMGYKAPDAKGKDPKAKKQPTIDEVIAQAQSAKLTGLDLQYTWPLKGSDVARIRAAGLELHVWTVDDVAVARHWVGLGVDSITTNRPGWLREQLKL
ncbi:MAG: glycerophosphodiester phosphodiesterase [Verrucomicrobia bacterium]|nr:glycerophosphodiester phosphodiesterase [Verrucomicrobiota bacterium]